MMFLQGGEKKSDVCWRDNMSIEKFIRDLSNLFNYPTDENPTTQQTYQAAVKNWVGTTEALVDNGLWQPTTNYAVGNQVKTPSLPSQYVLVCTAAGTSGNSEPDYTNVSQGDSVTDGTVTWLVGTLATAGGDNSSAGYPMLMLYDTTDSIFTILHTSYFGTQLFAAKPRTGGATHFLDGASLVLYPHTGAYKSGEFSLSAYDGTNSKTLVGKPDGTFTWNGYNVMTSEQKLIPNNSDLDDYDEPGVYYVTANAAAQSLSNCPTNASFCMTVNRGAYGIQTIFTGSTIYARKKTSAGWGSWYQYSGTQV